MPVLTGPKWRTRRRGPLAAILVTVFHLPSVRASTRQSALWASNVTCTVSTSVGLARSNCTQCGGGALGSGAQALRSLPTTRFQPSFTCSGGMSFIELDAVTFAPRARSSGSLFGTPMR